ncbi:SMP-30/gluconolactonase/LRE family protein [Actinokineospora sp. UTMC 2448]|uniref:SMP-30/gluconolactonase/LRE family protein n=1 Tax=Actinokineospora sp. UTMC 2448 TaxID=2268449 RepID=UPI0021648A13|nr:SMP-30/gluconolactonase/LRE family protein [Actinokineospora sp. UTMC 2448]UVS77495.1 L-arabinolactonase [Actinokineospora sp. UTMC 2448]
MNAECTEPVSTGRYELGEGARWVDGELHWVDILTGRLLVRRGGADVTLVELDVPLGAVAPLAGRPGRWVAAAGTGIAVLDPAAPDPLTWLARPAEEGVRQRMNDATVDPAGRFIAGSMAYAADEQPGAGRLHAVDPDGTVRTIVDGLAIPNGPVFSPDGTVMYLADSSRNRIDAYPYDVATGTVGEPRLFAEIEDHWPDGMAVEADGTVWSAVWGGGAVHRYRPDGSLIEAIPVPATRPTSVCFTESTVYVTSASMWLDRPSATDGAVFRLPRRVRGAAVPAARLDAC